MPAQRVYGCFHRALRTLSLVGREGVVACGIGISMTVDSHTGPPPAPTGL